MPDAPLWIPSPEQIERTHLARFMALARERTGLPMDSYDALWRWSVDDLAGFWALVWDFAQVRAAASWQSVVEARKMPGTTWFHGARLNFAENLLRHATGDHADATALVEHHESGTVRRLSYRELDRQAA